MPEIKKTAGILSAQLQQQKMIKEYLAVVEKAPPRETGRLTDMLLKDSRTNCSRVAEAGTAGARQAVLEYRCPGEAALRSGAAENQASDRKTSSDPGSAGTCGHAHRGGQEI